MSLSTLSKNQKILAASAVALAAGVAAIYLYANSGDKKPTAKDSQAPTLKQKPNFPQKNEGESELRTLYKKEAFLRSQFIKDVSYKITYALIKGGVNFHGQVEVTFTLENEPTVDDDFFFLDYKGEQVQSIAINNDYVTDGQWFRDDRVYLDKQLLNKGVNTVQIVFESKYVRDCQGIHYFKDTDDGNEYLYSQFEAADAHKAFPCFDQPDMKAPYEMLVFVPQGWIVLSTVQQESSADNGSMNFDHIMQEFKADKQKWLGFFENNKVSAFQFGKSQKISVYLYSLIAGPYELVESDQDDVLQYRFPLRLFCRKSLLKYVEKEKEQYFTISKCGIDYYEQLFSTKYPFGKLDQVFIPDYNMGAMENVGCVVYRDDYVPREGGEVFSDYRKEGILNVFLHEISHMWFGNLVTMKWWDDLWLNESFANYVSYICLDEAPGLEKYKNAWSIFLDESFWGLSEDQKDTTHPICVDAIHTMAAQDIFDGISYGKGASWLNQTFFLFGREVFKKGIKTYFEEYSFQNTQLSDFIKHMSEAAKKEGKEDFEAWSDTWLKTAGCNEIWHEIEEENGIIKKFVVNQRSYKHGDNNRLRKQKYQVAFYDVNMKVENVIDITTHDDKESFEVKDLVGTKAPHAYHINYKNYGYAKFKVDKKSLLVYQNQLSQIESSMSRKQIYNILFDMLRQNDLSGAQLFEICKNQLGSETAIGVITNLIKSIIPSIIRNFIPVEMYEECHFQMFEIILNNILTSGKIEDSQTKSLLIESLIGSARNDQHQNLIYKWYKEGIITNSNGVQIPNLEISLKHKHNFVQRVWSSQSISLDEKEKILNEIQQIDKTDWSENTKNVCESAHPGNKDKMWKIYFDEEQTKDWGLHKYQNSFSGFNQVQQRALLEKYEKDFFQNIKGIVKSKGKFVAEAYFYYLRPMNKTDDLSIKKYEDLLEEVLKDDPDNTFFILMLKDTICDLKVKKLGQELSKKYIQENKSKL